ncbi:MAG: hypothetical protein QOK39_788, partial [Acidimicrobiaceae bacterium]|nr:hypothetical protein [Acidimicrobiaceae bacterium]
EVDTELAAAAARHEMSIQSMRLECDLAVRAAVERAENAEQERARAEGTTEQLRADIDRIRDDLVDAREAIPRAVAAARAEQAEILGARHSADVEVLVARHEGRIARLEGDLNAAKAEAGAARERADMYREERDRLVGPEVPAPAKRAGPTRKRPPTGQGGDR